MKRLLIKLFIFSLTVCFIAGCRDPVGDINSGKGSSGVDLDFLWLVPNRLLYETEERFERDNDLQIMVAEDGLVKSIHPSDKAVRIEIIENPGLTSENITLVTSQYHPFSLPGRHVINVTYDEKSASYSIEVRGTFVNPGDGSDFLDIIWL